MLNGDRLHPCAKLTWCTLFAGHAGPCEVIPKREIPPGVYGPDRRRDTHARVPVAAAVAPVPPNHEAELAQLIEMGRRIGFGLVMQLALRAREMSNGGP